MNEDPGHRWGQSAWAGEGRQDRAGAAGRGWHQAGVQEPAQRTLGTGKPEGTLLPALAALGDGARTAAPYSLYNRGVAFRPRFGKDHCGNKINNKTVEVETTDRVISLRDSHSAVRVSSLWQLCGEPASSPPLGVRD